MTRKNQKAIDALNKIKSDMAAGAIDYDHAKDQATPYLKTMNEAGEAIAKKHGIAYKKITFIGFMR